MKLTKPFKGPHYFSQFFVGKHNGIDVNAMALPLGYGVPLCAPERVQIERIVTPGRLMAEGVEADKALAKGYGMRMRGMETGYSHLYWHMLPIMPVNAGEIIERGNIVGYMGNSGNVSSTAVGGYVPLKDRNTTKQGTHLHWEILDEGTFVDPYALTDWNTDPNYSVLHQLQMIVKTLQKARKILQTGL